MFLPIRLQPALSEQTKQQQRKKTVKSAKLFIFRTGNKIFEKYLTNSELSVLSTQPLIFTVPGLIPSTSYDYYMIINNGDVTAANLTALQALTQNDIASYNGTWSSVNDASTTPNRSGGFVMTGNTSATTSADLTQTQSVSITVKRITAKVDVNTVIDNTVFGSGNKYTGTLAIDSAIISKTQSTSSLLLGTPPTTAGTLPLAKQISNIATPNSNFQNRFYLFENGAYTVTANIKGLSGTSVSVTVTLSDWKTIVNQNANLGT